MKTTKAFHLNHLKTNLTIIAYVLLFQTNSQAEVTWDFEFEHTASGEIFSGSFKTDRTYIETQSGLELNYRLLEFTEFYIDNVDISDIFLDTSNPYAALPIPQPVMDEFTWNGSVTGTEHSLGLIGSGIDGLQGLEYWNRVVLHIFNSGTRTNSEFAMAADIERSDWQFEPTATIMPRLPAALINTGSKTIVPGNSFTIPVYLNSIGNVAGVSFTINYDSSAFSNPVITTTANSNSAQLLTNTSIPGSISVGIAFLNEVAFASGDLEILNLSFDTSATSPSGDYTISITSDPTVFEMVGTTGSQLNAQSVNGVITINNPPVANDDTESTDEDVPTIFNVLANDTDADSDPLTFSIVTDPSFGTAVVQPDQTVLYTPNANYHGDDSFTYVANDGLVNSNEATVTVTVNSVDDPANLTPTEFSTDEDVTLVETVTATDVDGLTNDSVYSIAAQPANGSATIGATSGEFTYIPDPNYFGTDTFMITVTDDDGYTADFTITINVLPVPDDPTAVNDLTNAIEDQTLNISFDDLIANDFDVDVETVQVKLGASDPSSAQSAVITENADSFTYDPREVQSIIELEPGETIDDTFSYTIEDPTGRTATGTVTITITGVGYEGDLTGLEFGGVNYENNFLDVTDFVKAGRFLVQLDTLGDTDRLFSSADTWPRDTGGDGVIGLSDWIQTGRYVVGLDPRTSKNGPTARIISGSPNLPATEDFLLGTSISANQNADSDNSVEIRLSGNNFQAGQYCIVTIGIISSGNASTLGATIEFDPDLMTYVGSSIVEGRAGSLTLIQNDRSVDQGLLGILVASSPGETLPPGNIDVLELEFELSIDHHSGPLEIALSDKILRSVVSSRTAKKLEFSSRNTTSNVRSITNFKEWARIHESRSENGNGQAVVLNEDEDSDGDGLSNAVEFVLGTNPIEENKIPLEASVKVVDGKPVFEAATQIITERGDFEVEVVPLDSLGTGAGSGGNGQSATESKFGREKRTFIFQADQQSGFYIVRIKNKNS